jgi:hypothetical protein
MTKTHTNLYYFIRFYFFNDKFPYMMREPVDVLKFISFSYEITKW